MAMKYPLPPLAPWYLTMTGSLISLASVISLGMGTPADVIHSLCLSLSDSHPRTARFP